MACRSAIGNSAQKGCYKTWIEYAMAEMVQLFFFKKKKLNESILPHYFVFSWKWYQSMSNKF